MSVRLAHFTDIHVTEPPQRIAWRQLFSKRVVGWANLRFFGRHSKLANAALVTRALVRDLALEEPDHIVSTGDYTGLSLPSEFQAAHDALEPLFADGDVTSIPGNHDVYVASAERQGLYDQWFGDWTRTDLGEADFPPDARAAFPYPLVRRLGDDVVLVCLRDARPTAFHDSSGRVPDSQLRALETLLRRADFKQRVKILALHYGLRRRDGTPDTRLHGLRNAEEVMRIAADAGVAMVVHGHLHRRFVHAQEALAPFAIADPGALAYEGGALAYHVYSVCAESITVEARRYDRQEDRFVAWKDAPGVGVVWRAKSL